MQKKNKETNEQKIPLSISMTQYNFIFMTAFDLVKQTILNNEDEFN